jgi:UDP-glucose 4-epimerase
LYKRNCIKDIISYLSSLFGVNNNNNINSEKKMSTFISHPVPGKQILVTGGAGYIGSHTVLQLLKRGHEVVVVDNLCNSVEESLKRVEVIAGKKVPFYLCDVLDKEELTKVFDTYNFWAVIHFAGLKSVFESCQYPERYMHNNVEGTRVLVECMVEHGVHNIVFSSSATLYGNPKNMDPLTEEAELGPINPYGESKLKAEQAITEAFKEYELGQACLLRYFNPIGADVTGLIGENPKDIPNNLLPYITQTLVGKRECLSVYGNDYPTRDGTGVRDYVHVVDLAEGHLAALEKLRENEVNRKGAKATIDERVLIYNMGTGNGYSVLEVIDSMNKASGKTVPYRFTERRKGDAAQVVACPAKANKELKWCTKFSINEMCADAWNWQSHNPDGYDNTTEFARNLLEKFKKEHAIEA